MIQGQILPLQLLLDRLGVINEVKDTPVERNLHRSLFNIPLLETLNQV